MQSEQRAHGKAGTSIFQEKKKFKNSGVITSSELSSGSTIDLPPCLTQGLVCNKVKIN
jgi:hypothetical protein